MLALYWGRREWRLRDGSGVLPQYVRAEIELVSGHDPGRVQAQIKLYLRLGEVCHLQGGELADHGRTKRDEARDAFTRAIRLEASLSRNEECVEGRLLISGYGARKFLRALLDWTMTEARAGNWVVVEDLIAEARDVHVVSLRRLSRHAADRAAVLLDEARIQRADGYVEQHRFDRRDEARAMYVKARELVRMAQSLRLQPGMPLAVSLDLDGLLARICIKLAEVYDGLQEDKKSLLRQADASARHLMRVADRFRLTVHMVHSRVLRFRIRLALNSVTEEFPFAQEDPDLMWGIREAISICDKTGLGLYRNELDKYLSMLPLR
jgi:hypothetical protein